MAVFYCIWALLLLIPQVAAAGQAPAGPAAATAQAAAAQGFRAFAIFLRGTPIGREELTMRADATGTTFTGVTRIAPPFNVVTRRAQVRYSRDWTPESLELDAAVNGSEIVLRTSFANGSVVSEGSNGGKRVTSTTPLAPQTFVLPNTFFFAAHDALGRRFASVGTTGEFHAFIAPDAELPFQVRNVSSDRMQTGTTLFNVRRYELAFVGAGGETVLYLTTAEDGGLIRLSVPSQGLEVVREDAATSTARNQLHSNPGDEALTIPGVGFNLGATLTRPKGPVAEGTRLPAVVLLGGSGMGDRDGYTAGVPILGQLAGALAEAGFVAVRYDKRGYGQSGGRSESATLTDFAEDARGVVRWLANRKDIDPRRIAVIGHNEGAWVALLAAAKDRRIAAVITIAAPSTTGAEVVLEQQQIALTQLNATADDRAAKVALQKKIHGAVQSGTGWEGVPAELRRQADTPWFQSLLAYDPARVMKDVRQPLLLVHGQLDRQVPVEHVERLTTLARMDSKSKSVEVVTVRGINHLLTPAITGEVAEYSTLEDRNVSAEVTMAVNAWLTKTLPPRP